MREGEGERKDNLRQAGRGLADHSKNFLTYCKAERSHW